MNRISLRSFMLLTDETSVSSLYLTTTVASYFVTLSFHNDIAHESNKNVF